MSLRKTIISGLSLLGVLGASNVSAQQIFEQTIAPTKALVRLVQDGNAEAFSAFMEKELGCHLEDQIEEAIINIRSTDGEIIATQVCDGEEATVSIEELRNGTPLPPETAVTPENFSDELRRRTIRLEEESGITEAETRVVPLLPNSGCEGLIQENVTYVNGNLLITGFENVADTAGNIAGEYYTSDGTAANFHDQSYVVNVINGEVRPATRSYEEVIGECLTK